MFRLTLLHACGKSLSTEADQFGFFLFCFFREHVPSLLASLQTIFSSLWLGLNPETSYEMLLGCIKQSCLITHPLYNINKATCQSDSGSCPVLVGDTDLKLPFAKLTGFDVELSNLYLHYIRLHKKPCCHSPLGRHQILIIGNGPSVLIQMKGFLYRNPQYW